jgi:putative zinc finger protein
MIDYREHSSFEELNDFLDDRLDEAAARAVLEHLAACEQCSRERDRLVGVLNGARSVSMSILPPDDIWPDLKKQLESRKTVVLPSTQLGPAASGGKAGATQRIWKSGPFLAAAALILVVLSSGITALVLRDGNRGDRTANPADLVAWPVNRAPAVLPAGFQETETQYNRTIQELQQAVNEQRGRLSPETVRIVERSLALVDSAIDEARSALLADPNDQVLVRLLSANYQRKLDLLRRASELGPRT